MGPVEEDKEEIRTEPFTLPPQFTWDEICLESEDQVIHIMLCVIARSRDKKKNEMHCNRTQ